jgi:hypothetical protein
MRSSIIFLSALATSVMGANNTGPYTLPTDFNIGLVESSELSMYPHNFFFHSNFFHNRLLIK